MTLTADGKIQLNENTLNFIRSIPGPISSLVVIGPYRSGKSYLLNRIAGKQQGFELGSSTNPCTQGVWLWPEPVSLSSSSPQTLLLDTEGLFALNRDDRFDTVLFLFSALISSLMIYNSFGVIDESALERLAFIGNIGTHFSRMNQTNNQSLLDHFPNFLWLLRDFALDLSFGDSGMKISADEYLESALIPRPPQPRGSKQGNSVSKKPSEYSTDDKRNSHFKESGGDSIKNGLRNSVYANASDDERNSIRRMIKTVFKNRSCSTLVRPVNEEHLLRNVDKLSIGDLRPKFNEEMEALIMKLSAMVQPKIVGRELMTGEHYAEFLIFVAQALNNTDVPVFENFNVV